MISNIKTTDAFCYKGKFINNTNMINNLIEHFSNWKKYVNRHGLIILELHTISPDLIKYNIGKTLATAYDATHGYSNQYIIEYEDFIDSAKLAGLKNNDDFEFNFPNEELTTVSINLFSV